MDTALVTQENRQRLVSYFASGAKPQRASRRLGVELEHHVVFDDGTPMSYEPSQVGIGVRDVLEHLSRWYPQQTINEYRDLLGLLGEEGTVTLEPAAQLELSAAPYERLADVRRAYERFYARTYECLLAHGAHLETLGYHPTRRARELTLIPKRRYSFMDAYFAHIGSHGDRMMRASASTQVSVDFFNEADAVRKMRVASAIAPILAAIADNTPVFEGERNHVPIRRLQLWREVDGRRCGTVSGIFEEGFGYERYAEWLLATSPIFVTRAAADDPNGPVLRPSFDEAASIAYADAPMGPRDMEHLISMFWPDVRLKRFVEIRPADSLPLLQMLGYAALVKGIFYQEESLRTIEDALGVDAGAAVTRGAWPLDAGDVDDAIARIQRRGFAAQVYGSSLASWERLLFSLARRTLDEDEASYLDYLEEFAAQKPWWRVSSAQQEGVS